MSAAALAGAGLVDPTACERTAHEPAPRPATLAGLAVLLVDATLHKSSAWGAGMLDAAAAVIGPDADCSRAELDPLDVRPGELWVDSVASASGAIVLAGGDCVTCTSRAARNVVLAERAGIPGAVVCTAATEPVVRAVGYSLGLPQLAVFAIVDSLFGRSREQIARLAAPALAALPASLTASR